MEHINTINEFGYCWFGKIGKMPQKSYLNAIYENGNLTLFLYTNNTLYKCKSTEYSYDLPDKGVPKYYETVLSTKEYLKPNVFFKILSISSVSIEVLNDYVVSSSGKPISHDLKKSISSFYIIQHKDSWQKKEKKSENPPPKKDTVIYLKDTCIYRIQGVCTKRNFVNYEYECKYPNKCAKQKMKTEKKES